MTNISYDRLISEYNFGGNKHIQVYDLKSHESMTANMPTDFETSVFLVDDLLFYQNNSSEDYYLSAFVLNK